MHVSIGITLVLATMEENYIFVVPVADWIEICYMKDTYKINYTHGFKLKHRTMDIEAKLKLFGHQGMDVLTHQHID